MILASGHFGFFLMPVVFSLFAIGIVGLIVYQFMQRAKRRDAIMAYCQQHGYTFIEKSHGHDEAYHGFEPFGIGSSRTARHIIRGDRGDADFEVFQYEYTVQSGKNSHTHIHRVAVVQTPMACPGLTIRPEHLGHKIFDALGGEDLDFESDEFSRKYWVKARDRQQAYAIIHPRMQQWLLDQPPLKLQWRGHALLVHETGHLRVHDIHRLMKILDTFLGHLPRHLLHDRAKP